MRARDNPLRTEKLLQIQYRLKGFTWAELLSRCQSKGYRGALIGPHGSGKTTLLETLEPKLRDHGFNTRFIRLSEEHPVFDPGFVENLQSQITAHDILLFDGAEQMSSWAWHWFRWQTRGAGGLIITTHRAGRQPTLWECRTSPELLAEVAAELLQMESTALAKQAEALYHKHRGNLRDALRDWYDLLADHAFHLDSTNTCVQ